MQEGAKHFEPIINEVSPVEKKYTVDSAGYRQYEMTCIECQKDFTRNIPDDWFNGNDQIKEHNLPEGLTLETAQKILDDPICGACQPETKAKLDKLSQLNKKL